MKGKKAKLLRATAKILGITNTRIKRIYKKISRAQRLAVIAQSKDLP